MRGRVLALIACALLAAPFAAHAVAAQSYCQYVCVDESCRLEQSVDVPCGDAAPTVLQVSDDPEATACLPEPVTLDMVQDTTAYTFTTSAKAATTGLGDQPAPGQPTQTPPPTTQPPAPAPAPPPPAKQDVVLTGFCKFDGVPENPTERILPALEKAIKDKCGANINLTSQCLNVNIQAIRDCKVQKKIVISLGVDPNTNEFRLETAAANCFVDYNGKVKCTPVCIDPAKPIDNTVKAPGPWPTLPKDPKIGDFPIKTGKPGTAGDYVCNATFYWLCTQKECKPYFIHTPDFGKDKDKDVVPGLADLICKILDANKPAAKSLRWAWTR